MSASHEPGQLVPTSERPFIFYHARKSGGSSIRSAIHKRMSEADPAAATWLPCYEGVKCTAYFPTDPTIHYSVIGGHVYRAMVDRWWRSGGLPRARPGQRPRPSIDGGVHRRAPACFVMLRETASRVASCWDYRLVAGLRRRLDDGRARPPGTMSTNTTLLAPRGERTPGGVSPTVRAYSATPAAQLDALLPHAYSIYNEGCNHETARLIAAVGIDEARVNTLTSGIDHLPEALGALGDVLEQLPKCVIGVIERCDETMRNLHLHLPWLAPYYNCSRPPKPPCNASGLSLLYRGEMNMMCAPTSPVDAAEDARRRRVVYRHNAVDELAYAFANRLLDSQLSAGDGSQ